MTMKRQITKWKYWVQCADGTYIKVGYIHNKRRGVLKDVIRVKIKSATPGGDLDYAMKFDEACAFVAGLSRVIAHMAYNQLPQIGMRCD